MDEIKKQKKSESDRKYRETHKETYKEYQKEYREKNKGYQKEYREKNKEKTKEYNRKYIETHKETYKEYQKEYREKNKEKTKEYNRKYSETNKEKNKEKNKQYQQKYRKTPSGEKAFRKGSWKYIGLDMDNFEEVYQRYLDTTNCDKCNVLLTNGEHCKTTKCMDHCHYTNKFRRVLCLSCNSQEKQQPKEDIEVFLARTHREQNLAEHNIKENF